MVALTKRNERLSKTRIADMIDKAGDTSGYPRYYLGMSGLGNSCMRALWFGFRWPHKGSISGRTNRIFNVGHAAEHDLVKSLESVGIECWNVCEDQDEFVDGHGYIKAHPDGYARNIPGAEKTVHLLEFKTMNDKSFKDTVKKGVEVSKPIYYAQMVLYMYKKGLTRALFMAVNKNDSSYYLERIKNNDSFAKELLSKGQDIIFSENFNDFPRIGTNKQSWYECKWCNYSDVCFGDNSGLEPNCRNCSDCNLLGEGKFACGEDSDRVLKVEEQEKGCEKHDYLECFK